MIRAAGHIRQFKALICLVIPLLLTYKVKAQGNLATNYYRNLRLTTETYPDESTTLENIPKIPDGHRHFQFYTLDPNGNLQKQWMSLQEVQHIILAHAYQNHSKHKVSLYQRPPYNAHKVVQNDDGFLQKLAWQNKEKRPETSIEDVLANVQKVMSKEITKTYLKGDFPTSPTLPDGQPVTEAIFSDDEGVTAQNITIPDTILGHLMRDQVASLESHNPWGILTTPGVGGNLNPILKKMREKFKERTTIKPSEVDPLIEENFVEGGDVKVTLNLDKNVPTTENSLFNDADSLIQLNPEIFDSTTEVPEDVDSSLNSFETTTEAITLSGKDNKNSPISGENIPIVNSESQAYFTTEKYPTTDKYFTTENYFTSEKTNYENEYKIFKNQYGANLDAIESTNDPGETWTTSNIIYTKDKPSYTIIPVEDLPNSKQQSEDLEFTYKNDHEKNVHQTTTSVNEEEKLFEIVTTLSYPTITEYVQATDSTIQIYPTTTPFVNNLTKLPSISKESLNEVSSKNTYNQKLGDKNFENSKFSVDEETEIKFKNNLGGEIGITYLNNDRHASSSSVLTPSEIAKGSVGHVGTVGILQNKQDYNFSYYDTAIYLEDISEMDYDFDDTAGIPKPNKNVNTSKITFPSPNVTDSYHKPDHISHSHDSKGQPVANKDPNSHLDPDDPLQFLPAHNPAIAQRENPLQPTPVGNIGLEATVADMDPSIRKYVNSMNDISFQVYKKAAEVHRRQNMVMAPINLISALSMLLLAARNNTADALSKLLKFDELLTFNPHLILKNVTESLIALNYLKHEAAFVNNLFIEKSNKKSLSLDFFDQTMEFFYGTKIMEVPEHTIGPRARDHANELIRAHTLGVVHNFLKPNASLKVVGPLSVVSSSYFQGDWGIGINEKDLIDMSFIRFPSAERRLIKTVGVLRRMEINAGYSQELDATVAEVPLHGSSKEVSLILVMPGQQKSFVANGLSQLEQSLASEGWAKLLRAVVPHTINFKMPIFSHRNYLNLSGILSIMGLRELFSTSADFSGINGLKTLHLGDVVQLSEFHSCKLEMRPFVPTDGRYQDKNSEWSTNRDGKSKSDEEINAYNDAEKHRKNYLKKAADYVKKKEVDERKNRRNISSKSAKSLRRRRQNDRISNFYRNDNTLAYDRAFFYVLRHNPTGLILFIGRYLDPEVF